jgi:hypothetical protein
MHTKILPVKAVNITVVNAISSIMMTTTGWESLLDVVSLEFILWFAALNMLITAAQLSIDLLSSLINFIAFAILDKLRYQLGNVYIFCSNYKKTIPF